MESVKRSLNRRVDEVSKEFTKLFSINNYYVHDQYGNIKNDKPKLMNSNLKDNLETTKNFILKIEA